MLSETQTMILSFFFMFNSQTTYQGKKARKKSIAADQPASRVSHSTYYCESATIWASGLTACDYSEVGDTDWACLYRNIRVPKSLDGITLRVEADRKAYCQHVLIAVTS